MVSRWIRALLIAAVSTAVAALFLRWMSFGSPARRRSGRSLSHEDVVGSLTDAERELMLRELDQHV